MRQNANPNAQQSGQQNGKSNTDKTYQLGGSPHSSFAQPPSKPVAKAPPASTITPSASETTSLLGGSKRQTAANPTPVDNSPVREGERSVLDSCCTM